MEESIDYPINKSHKRMENNQYPDNAEHIEYQVRQRCPFGLRIGSKSSQISGNSSTDILTQHQCRSKFETNPTISTHYQSNSHGCRRSLYNHCQYRTDKKEQEHREKTHIRIILYKSQHIGVSIQIGSITF